MRLRFILACLLLLSLTALIAPVAAQEAINVPVWIAFTDYRLDWAREKAAAFNELFPQYNVTVEGYPDYETLFTATALAAEQNELPAIVHFFEAGTQRAIDSGYFKSMADVLAGREEVNGVPVAFEDFIGPVLGYYTIGGQVNSMPFNTSSAIMFNNMDILRAAGIETPPATWQEIEAACAQIMALDTPPQVCFTFPNHGWFFEQWLATQNGTYVNNDNGRSALPTEVTFNGPEGVAILEWLDRMLAAGYLYYGGGQGGDSWANVDTVFLPGDAAMAAYSSSDTTLYTNTGAENGFEVAASFLPYNGDVGRTGNVIGGGTLWLVNNLAPEVEEGALTFLLWFANSENAAEWHELTGYVPVRLSSLTAETEAGFYNDNPNLAVAAQQLAESETTPATSGALLGPLPDVRNLVTQAIDTVLLTDEDPQAVLDAAAAEANTIIEEYNLLSAE